LTELSISGIVIDCSPRSVFISLGNIRDTTFLTLCRTLQNIHHTHCCV
jgi:hypothetical protein